MIELVLPAILFGTAVLATPPLDSSPADRADGRCMAALTALSGMAASADKAGVDASMMFFMGKIVGRSGKAALGAALRSVGEKIPGAEVPGIAEKCVDEIGAASEAM